MNKDDSAILSVDFLAGFTIFLVALIFVINMVPSLLIGVHSSTVDYDAVAYRTSVILAEDPGWPYSPAWELEDNSHKDDIERLGLAVSSDTPNILSTNKINKFFSKTADFNFTEEEYRSKTIFGDLPYSFNISLKDESSYPLYTGNTVPESSYGYMKRLVKIKHYSSADVPAGDLNQTEVNLSVPYGPFIYEDSVSFTLQYSNLSDRTISPAYRIDPKSEPITFRLSNFSESLNFSTGEIQSVTLDRTRFFKDGVVVPMAYENIDNDTYIFTVDEVQYNMTPSLDMKDKSSLEFELMPTLMYSSEITSSLSLAFNFTYVFGKNTSNYPISGSIPYSYGSPYIRGPYLTDGVMEVCIW